MGKSYRTRSEYQKSNGNSDDDDGEEFDYNEYLRKEAEEKDVEKSVSETIEIEDSLQDWHSMSDQEKEELKNSQTREKK